MRPEEGDAGASPGDVAAASVVVKDRALWAMKSQSLAAAAATATGKETTMVATEELVRSEEKKERRARRPKRRGFGFAVKEGEKVSVCFCLWKVFKAQDKASVAKESASVETERGTDSDNDRVRFNLWKRYLHSSDPQRHPPSLTPNLNTKTKTIRQHPSLGPSLPRRHSQPTPKNECRRV